MRKTLWGFALVPLAALALLLVTPRAAAATLDGHCYVSGAVDVDGGYPGYEYFVTDGWATLSDDVPGGYDSTWFHAACNAIAVRIKVWAAEQDYVDCLEGWPADGNNACGNDSPVENPSTFAISESYKQEGYYGVHTGYAQIYYWSGLNGQPTTLHDSLQTSDDYDFGDPDPGGGGGGDICAGGNICTPILLPTSKVNAFPLTDAANGVRFDLDGDGVKEQTAWTQAGAAVAFLALDRNGNGTIDDGTELFGDATVPGVTNGFAALKRLVASGRNAVTNADPLFAQLLLWTDANHDGVSQSGELQPLSNLYSEISLGYAGHNRRDGHGNLFRFVGTAVERYDEARGELSLDKRQSLTRRIYDVFFVR